MANGHPKFGTLDVGQPGGTRAQAATALFSGQVIIGSDSIASAEHGLPQQNIVFRDVLGYRGATVVWRATIRANSTAMMDTIRSDINQRIHGAARDANGQLGAPSPSLMQPDTLTDAYGTTLSEKAVLISFVQRGRQLKGQEWPAIIQVELTFKRLN